MEFRKLSSVAERRIDTIITSLGLAGCGVIAIMALVVFGNVIGRFLFRSPLLGTLELVEFMMIVIASVAIPYAAIKRGNVRIDLITSRLSRRIRAVLATITYFLSIGAVAVIASQAYVTSASDLKGLDLGKMLTTEVLSIPIAPFRFILFLGFLALCIILILCIFNPSPPGEERGARF
ncbi:TRAP transporter small permease subunit [Chloroflexota bacterium]